MIHQATDLADELRKRSGRLKGKKLSKTWFRPFIRRWPSLCLTAHSELKKNRAQATTEEVTSKYYAELERIMEQHNLQNKPQNVYSIDETDLKFAYRISDAANGVDPRKTFSKAQKIGTAFLLACGSASGNALPPYYVFKGTRRSADLLSGDIPGSKMFMTQCSWCNRDVFMDFLKNHFLPSLPPRADDEFLLLLYDGHTSHVSKPVIDFAKENRIVMFVLPAHTSPVLKLPNVACFASMRACYKTECVNFLEDNPGRVITRFDLARLSSQAYVEALQEENLQEAFRKAGICPFNPNAVWGED